MNKKTRRAVFYARNHPRIGYGQTGTCTDRRYKTPTWFFPDGLNVPIKVKPSDLWTESMGYVNGTEAPL